MSTDPWADLENYQKDPERAPGEWKGYQGARWAARNPVSVEDSDLSFMRRYGHTKSWIMRDALRSVPRGLTWLEVGCSAGAFLELLASLDFAVGAGMDISFEPLQGNGFRGRVVQADALHLPFKAGAVDGVATAGSFMHLGPNARMTACAQELARVARRWILLAELASESPEIVSFGELIPPVWLHPWQLAMPEMLGPGWVVRYHALYELTKGGGVKAPFCVLLLERVT